MELSRPQAGPSRNRSLSGWIPKSCRAATKFVTLSPLVLHFMVRIRFSCEGRRYAAGSGATRCSFQDVPEAGPKTGGGVQLLGDLAQRPLLIAKSPNYDKD